MRTKKEIRQLEFNHCYYKVEEIEVRERARKDFGNIQELAHSIKSTCLLNPITVTTTGVTPPFKVRLVAGERRLRSLSYLIKSGEIEDSIPCRVLETIDDYTYKLIEMSENLYRKALDYREELALKTQIMKLGQELQGKASKNGTGFSVEKAAEIVGVSQSSMSRDLLLDKQITSLENAGFDTSKLKTKEDASKFVKLIGKTANRKITSAAIKKSMADFDAHKRKVIDAFVVGDCLIEMQKLQDASFDFAEIDPPYAIDLKGSKKGIETNYVSYNEVSQVDYVDFMYTLLHTVHKKLKPDAFVVLWHASIWLPVIQAIVDGITLNDVKTLYSLFIKKNDCIVGAKSTGKLFNVETQGIWVKPVGQSMRPEEKLASSYEMFTLLKKGKPRLATPGTGNVFTYQPVNPNNKVHPTERPAELISKLLTTFARTNDNILVPFAGSGRTLLEAAKLGMSCIGYDLSKLYKDSYIIAVNKEIR